ncbi:thyroid transcription factor 1-associated protein 26 isoform X2 [Canis lupus familiaris]|uniref:thyroid transcription factor 1-associated protein 26 isoform X2 n=1 Tax=Canis lupus familiaris TaxID=9615 RepID=UPI0015F1393A|nr:thyroid transcription factor 1-associated protein 26 isoform X2 [Canis lupus familiaris]
MAPVGPAAGWPPGGLGTRSARASSAGFRSKDVKQRTWRSNHPQAFQGSVREGQGFAFRRKLKIQQHYKKLQWREKKGQTPQESQFTDRYPDHLKHLYLAEEERLRKQVRKVEQPLSEEQTDQPLPQEQCDIEKASSEEHCSFEQPQSAEQVPLPFQRKIKRKRQIKKHGKHMSKYKLSVLLRDRNSRRENEREKKLKGSIKRRKWKYSKY